MSGLILKRDVIAHPLLVISLIGFTGFCAALWGRPKTFLELMRFRP